MSKAKRGKFIVIDGGEGAGKTTVLKAFAESFRGKLLMTHEPGGTPLADKIRALALSDEAHKASAETQFCLMWAARTEHLENKIEPALSKGIHVITDRFDSSTYAYQICAQGAGHLEKLFWAVRKYFLRKTKPDLYIFFDVTPEIGMKRVAIRKEKKTHFDERALNFHRKVRAGFLKFLKRVPHYTIDTKRPLDVVQADFERIILKVIK